MLGVSARVSPSSAPHQMIRHVSYLDGDCWFYVMPTTDDSPGRAVVTCTGCGTPYAAVVDEDGEVALMGLEHDACPNCEGAGFARLSM